MPLSFHFPTKDVQAIVLRIVSAFNLSTNTQVPVAILEGAKKASFNLFELHENKIKDKIIVATIIFLQNFSFCE